MIRKSQNDITFWHQRCQNFGCLSVKETSNWQLLITVFWESIFECLFWFLFPWKLSKKINNALETTTTMMMTMTTMMAATTTTMTMIKGNDGTRRKRNKGKAERDNHRLSKLQNEKATKRGKDGMRERRNEGTTEWDNNRMSQLQKRTTIERGNDWTKGTTEKRE